MKTIKIINEWLSDATQELEKHEQTNSKTSRGQAIIQISTEIVWNRNKQKYKISTLLGKKYKRSGLISRFIQMTKVNSRSDQQPK